MKINSDLETVRRILESHKQEILDSYGAEGVGVGQDPKDVHSYVIVVYLSAKEKQPSAPVTIEGIPLRFEVTGRFKLHT